MSPWRAGAESFLLEMGCILEALSACPISDRASILRYLTLRKSRAKMASGLQDPSLLQYSTRYTHHGGFQMQLTEPLFVVLPPSATSSFVWFLLTLPLSHLLHAGFVMWLPIGAGVPTTPGSQRMGVTFHPLRF